MRPSAGQAVPVMPPVQDRRPTSEPIELFVDGVFAHLQPAIADVSHFLVRGIARDLDFHLAGRAHTAIAVRRLLAGHSDLHSHHGTGLLRRLSIERVATVTAGIAIDYGR